MQAIYNISQPCISELVEGVLAKAWYLWMKYDNLIESILFFLN